MSDYEEHLRRCADDLHERAKILRHEARVLSKEADELEREARDLFDLALIERLKRWLNRM